MQARERGRETWLREEGEGAHMRVKMSDTNVFIEMDASGGCELHGVSLDIQSFLTIVCRNPPQ